MPPKKRKAEAEPKAEEPLIDLPQAPQATEDTPADREIPGLDPKDPFYVEKSRLLTKDTVFLGRSCKQALLEFQKFANAACLRNKNAEDAPDEQEVERLRSKAPVSYTHLTLPTILLV